MYTCQQCNRQYRSKTALTRHSHNHAVNGQHECPVCGIGFRRHDLLSRHAKIHQASQDGARPRLRCHTACASCRREKKRCDGENPCSNCAAESRPCSYAYRSRRTSRAPRSNNAANTSRQDVLATDTEECIHVEDSPASVTGLMNDDVISTVTTGTTAPDQQSDMSAPLEIDRDCMQPSDPYAAAPGVAILNFGDVENMSFDAEHDNLFAFQQILGSTPLPSDIEDASWAWTHQNIFFQEGGGLYSSLPDSLLDPTYPALAHPFVSEVAQNYIMGNSILHPGTDNLSLQQQSVVAERTNGSETNHAQKAALQNSVLEDMISCAFNVSDASNPRDCNWTNVSKRVHEAFLVENEVKSSTNRLLLDSYVDLYFEYFHPLWPLLWYRGLKYDHIHPILYLVLVSIGTMYNGTASQKFGAALHERTRTALLMLPLEVNLPEGDMLHVCCALLLTQVTALYFEQKHAFSAAQRLGGMLVALAHRLELFHQGKPNPELRHLANGSENTELKVSTWLSSEIRKRIAFGIMRVETFISVLLNIKPMVDYEQLNLDLPVSDRIWTSQSDSAHKLLESIDRDRAVGTGMLYSDLVRIALDSNEPLPIAKATGHELILFGLQQSIWRFSHDHDMFHRLTSHRQALNQDAQGTNSSITSAIDSSNSPDYLDFTSRKMSDLRRERDRVVDALEKWKRGLTHSQHIASESGANRSIYLSSMILYNLSHLRLGAPMSILQQVAYDLNNKRKFRPGHIETIRVWASDKEAPNVVSHACAIYALIRSETSRPKVDQARYNILALIGLHQASIAVWVFSSCRETSKMSLSCGSVQNQSEGTDAILARSNIDALLNKFVRLYPEITPAWGMQSSFAKIALSMSKQPLPMEPT